MRAANVGKSRLGLKRNLRDRARKEGNENESKDKSKQTN